MRIIDEIVQCENKFYPYLVQKQFLTLINKKNNCH